MGLLLHQLWTNYISLSKFVFGHNLKLGQQFLYQLSLALTDYESSVTAVYSYSYKCLRTCKCFPTDLDKQGCKIAIELFNEIIVPGSLAITNEIKGLT